MTRPGRTGMPDVDALLDVHDTEQARLDERVVIGQAEGVVATARHGELAAVQQAAARRVSAAKGRLTRARKDGNAEKITAAGRHLFAMQADYERIADEAIAEMQQLTRARLDSLGGVLEQMGRTWDAGDAAIHALANPPPDRPERPEGGQ